jgi:hypothetical protein
MAFCPVCDKTLICPDEGDSRHSQAVGSVVKDCPLRKGFIWVQVLDDKGGAVLKAAVTIAGKAAETDDAGFAHSEPLDANTYDVALGTTLPDPFKDTHLLPEKVTLPAKVVSGEVTLIKFRLDRINTVTPKIEEEYKVVLLDRGLAAHQTGELDSDKIFAEATRIEVSVSETNREQFPFKTTATLKFEPANVEVFLDDACATQLTEAIKADQISGGQKLKLWLRGKTAGKFDVSLELADTADKHIVAAKNVPKLGMGVVELVLDVYEQDLVEIKKLEVDPDQEPLSDYHTALKDKALPAQKLIAPDEDKIKKGRLLHEQKDGNHGRAKIVIKKLVTGHLPDGTDDYEVYLNRSNKSGDVAVYDAETDGALQAFPAGPFKFSALKTAEKELWLEGKTACSKLRHVRLDLCLDRPDGGLDKDPKRCGDAARFTVVKIKEVKLDYKADPGKADAWDEAEKRFFINFKADPDGRKITIGAQLSAELADVVIHFMLVEHKDNRKTANWGVDLPDGTRGLTPAAVVDNGGTPQVFGGTEPQWIWKDIKKEVKHLDKTKRKDILHLSEKTDAKGYAKKEVELSRFAGDKFYLAAYIEQDPHLAKYIDGHTDLGKRKPVMREDPIQVWRKFWYREVKVAGLLVSDFRDAADTYEDVKAVMAAGTVVEMPRVTADAINPKVIYPKHMVSYFVNAGSYNNNYPGDAGDALVVGDTNRSQFFSLASAEADKPVMYAMMNVHALWVPGGVDSAPVSEGPFTYPYTETTSFPVSFTATNELLDPPLQGGNLLVAGQGKWKAEDWVPHTDPLLPTAPDAPAGAPPGKWGNRRQGNLASGDVSLDPNRSDPRVLRVTVPAAVVVGTYTRVKISGLHVQCAQSFLGTSYPDGIVNAYTLNDVQDFVNTVNHETGHSFKQVTTTQPGDVPEHPLKYENQGTHCAYDNSSCVMFESGPQPGSLNRYCPVCHPYMLVADMSTVNGILT